MVHKMLPKGSDVKKPYFMNPPDIKPGNSALTESKKKLYQALLDLDFIGKNMVGVVSIEIVLVPGGIHEVSAVTKIRYK